MNYEEKIIKLYDDMFKTGDDTNILWRKEGNYEWLYAQRETYVLRDVIHKTVHIVSARSPSQAVRMVEIQNKGQNPMTSSHSEKDILSGCIDLMYEVFDDMIDYMEWRDIEIPTDVEDEEYPIFQYPYTRIVKKLFLSATSHSGWTSASMKCKELGITQYALTLEMGDSDEQN